MLILCAGTATDIGKTWVGAATLRSLRDRGHSVAARKPAQSFDPADGHRWVRFSFAGATADVSGALDRLRDWLA